MSEKKDDIVRAMLKLIAVNGPTDISSKKIAKEAGCSDALVYKYFTNNEGLVKGCLEYMHRLNSELFERLYEATKHIDDTPTRLRTISDIYLDYHIEHWAETLAFDQLKKTLFSAEIEEDYKKLQKENINYIVDKARLRSFVDEAEKTAPFWAWWTHMVHVTVFFVGKVRSGVLTEGEHTNELYYNILFKGTRHIFAGGA